MGTLNKRENLAADLLAELDAIDRILVEGVECCLQPEHLLRSAPCSSADAAARLRRLVDRGVLEAHGFLSFIPPPQRDSQVAVGGIAAPVVANGAPLASPGSTSQSATSTPKRVAVQPPPAVVREEPVGRRFAPVRPPPAAVCEERIIRPRVETAKVKDEGVAKLRAEAAAASAREEVRARAATPAKSPTGPIPVTKSQSGPISMPKSAAGPITRTQGAVPAQEPPAAEPPPPEPPAGAELQALIRQFEHGSDAQRRACLHLREAVRQEERGQWAAAASALQVVLLKLKEPRIAAVRDRFKQRHAEATNELAGLRERAAAAQRAKDHKTAGELWSKVAERSPSDLEAHVRAAAALLQATDHKRAARFAQRSVELAPKNASVRSVLLRYYEASGQEAAALKERQLIRELRQASVRDEEDYLVG